LKEEAVALFMHEVLFESSSSESDEELVLEELYFLKKRKRRNISNYIEDVVDNYDDQMFRENFRMYRATFELLLHLLEDKISSSVIDVGRHTISSKAQLLLTIWYFATPDSYRLISLLDYLQGNNRIHVSRSTDCKKGNLLLEQSLRILTFRAYVIINFYSHIAMQEKLVPAMMLKS
jgi:hypothetical protein